MKFLEDRFLAKELEKALIHKNFTHSYLFYGPRGIGKFQMAADFASRILCEDMPDSCFCNIKENFTHPDLIVVKSKDTIKKSQIEEVIEKASSKPFESNYKIILIDNFHDTTEEGQNALLKTLEEPPEYLKLFFVSHNMKKILPTILSRVRILRFQNIAPKRLEEFLKAYGISEKNAVLFAGLSQGSVAKALRYYEEPQLLAKREELIDQLDRILREGGTRVFSALEYFKNHREEVEEILKFLLLWFRDLAFLALEEERLIINVDKIKILKLENVSLEHSLFCFDQTLEAMEALTKNINYDLTIQVLLMNIGGIR